MIASCLALYLWRCFHSTTRAGVSKIHAIIGGFHLAPFKDDYVRDVVSAIKQLDPDYVVPMHCSGEASPCMSAVTPWIWRRSIPRQVGISSRRALRHTSNYDAFSGLAGVTRSERYRGSEDCG